MKKIFTLLALVIVAMSAMAENYNERSVMTYNDKLNVTVDGNDPVDETASITITEQAEAGMYTIQLNKFSFSGLLIGDVTMTDVKGVTDAEGFTNYATTQTATITNGDFIMEMLEGKIDVTVKEGTRSKDGKFYALISLYVPSVGPVEAVFGDNDFTNGIQTTKADKNNKVAAIYTIGGQRVDTMVRGVNIVKMTNGDTFKVVNK